MYYANEIVRELEQSSQIAIFGAGIMAFNVAGCLLEKPYELNITCCLVSDLKANPPSVIGIPVIDFSMAKHMLKKDATILVGAALGKNLASMQERLRENGYFHMISFTYEGDLWSLLRGNSFREFLSSQNQPYLTLEEELERTVDCEEVCEKSIQIYTAKCHVDRPIGEELSRYTWETPIQVGADLTQERICQILDNTGDHISHKNRQYCEITALYWIWKNDRSDYVGLGHYRRHFELSEEKIRRLTNSDIDVVLTIPIFDYPCVEAVYRRDHEGNDWEVMLKAIEGLTPEYMREAEELQSGRYYNAYNMFLMRREILEDYCEWLFPILSYCEAYCKEKRDTYQNRYLGFLAEHLMAIYFLHHKNSYKIVYARKHFVEDTGVLVYNPESE